MIPDHYVWFVWSVAFLVPWLAAYLAFPEQRRAILWSSLFTMPFGLTEPLFVPEYWNPPSLFNLAQRTGFDSESLIFSFGIGGIGATLYNLLTGRTSIDLYSVEQSAPRHKYHVWALAVPFVAFPLLYLLPWNPIYAGIVAIALGATATAFCRPDLVLKIGLGALLFVGYYTVFLLGLELTSPGYIERVWSLSALSGIDVAGLPVEELLFAAGFGAYWSSVYEHFTWRGSLSGQGSALS